MKPDLRPGVKATFEVTVSEDMRPQFDGVFVHDVMSTVSMIYYMERAGRQVLVPYLEEDEEGAGFAIDIRHVGPAVVGQRVRFTATCTEVTQRRIVCLVAAVTDCNVVGEGIFTQAIFNKRVLSERIAQLSEHIEGLGNQAARQEVVED